MGYVTRAQNAGAIRWSGAKLGHTFTQRLHIHTQTPDRARPCTQYPNFLYLICHDFSDRERQPLTQKGWQFYKVEDAQNMEGNIRGNQREEEEGCWKKTSRSYLQEGSKAEPDELIDERRLGTVQSIPKD